MKYEPFIVFSLFLTVAAVFVIYLQPVYAVVFPTCDEPFEEVILPPWLFNVSICFENEDRIFVMNEKIPVHIYAEVNETTDWIRLHIFHSSQLSYFEETGTKRQEIIEIRGDQDHLVNLGDNRLIFGIDLENATTNIINCNDPPCHVPYEKSTILEFTEPGIYQYEVTMQTADGKFPSYQSTVTLFKVLDAAEELQMKSNKAILEKPEPSQLSKPDDKLPDQGVLSVFEHPIVSGLTVATIAAVVGYVIRTIFKRRNENLFIISLDSGLDLERFFEGQTQYIRVRNSGMKTIENCVVLCNDESCPWWDNNTTNPRNIYSGGGGNARINVPYGINAKISIKSGNKIIRELPLSEISLGVP